MDLEVVGRHALLFDDDAMAEFVNSPAALVDWNSLSIDRYDVRHLLPAPPPPRSLRRRPLQDSLETELDRERYLDLISAPDIQDSENGAGSENGGGYNAVSFSYGNPSETTDYKSTDAESGFRPPFPVPENLLQHLPPTDKVHQIIARTATFVRKHGGQSEIVLRVKQGDNPTFGFLMPDHDLHPYFSFLVDQQELLKAESDGKSADQDDKIDSGLEQTGGSLSLLGSVYGSVEDEEGPTEAAPPLAENNLVDTPDIDNLNASRGPDQKKDEEVPKVTGSYSKEKTHVIKKNRSISTVKAVPMSESKKEGDSLGSNASSMEKLQGSVSSGLSKIEAFVLEPPSDLKRVVDKIVEFILRNGREFEAVLVQQDSKHGRFPFLIPTNQYHAYYLKVLRETQKSRLGGKGLSEKRDSLGQSGDRKPASKASDMPPLASDIPQDSDRKEKFKMVIGKSKKDFQDSTSKATEGVSVDAAAAAAILQAATKGIKNPNLSLLSRAPINVTSQGLSSEGGGPTISNSHHSSQSQNIVEPGVSAPVAKAIAKTAAIAAASEADSSEAGMTREQKLKAERLKRAKLFAAMIKSRSAPLKDEPLRGFSVEPPESGGSVSGAETMNVVGRERERSSVPLDADISEKSERIDKKEFAEVDNERWSKRSYRSRSKRGEEGEEDEEDAGNEVGGEEAVEEDRNHKHSGKKRRSRHSSHQSRDRHKHRRRHSSSKDKYSRSQHKNSSISDDENLKNDSLLDNEDAHHRHKHKEISSSDEEHRRSKHRHKHDIPSEDEDRYSKHKHGSSSIDEDRHSRHKRKHYNSSDDEHRHSRRRHEDGNPSDVEDRHSRRRKKHGNSPDDEYQHEAKSTKHRKRSQPEKEAELEEGEILTKSDQSRGSEGGDDLSKSNQDVRAPSQPSESTEVSDELRAKVRAMLMATL